MDICGGKGGVSLLSYSRIENLENMLSVLELIFVLGLFCVCLWEGKKSTAITRISDGF